jgi:hypothetical protein
VPIAVGMGWPRRLLQLDVVGGEHAAVAFTLAVPTPESVTMALLGGTLAAAGWVAKQRRVALSSLHADAPTV